MFIRRRRARKRLRSRAYIPDLVELEEELELWDILDHDVPMSMVIGPNSIDDVS